MNKFKLLVAATTITTILTGCSLFAPAVVAVVDNESYKAVFTDAKCSNENVLALIAQEKMLAKAMGVPQELIDKAYADLKQGEVLLKRTQEKRAFCYKMGQDGTAAVMDEAGSGGQVEITPKK